MPPSPMQYCWRPALQLSHSRQESTKQPTPTWSPTLYLVTPDPTSVTMPASSWPATTGQFGWPPPPLTGWMSEWQMPANLMSNATSCCPTSLRSMVVLASGPVADVAAMAETVVVMSSTCPLLVVSQTVAKNLSGGN